MQNVTILGITLQDRTLQETIRAAGRYLQNGALNVVAYVNHDVLVYADRDDNVGKMITNAAMTLWEDKHILKLIGITDADRSNEIATRAFLKEMFDRLVRDGNEIALAGISSEAIASLKEELLAVEPNLKVVHETIIDSAQEGIPESEINGINEHSPAMIIARGDYAVQQRWLSLAGSMINAGIWLAMPEGMPIERVETGSLLRRLWHKLSFGVFSIRAKRAMEGNNDIKSGPSEHD